jgi:sulfur relay (sulfurtransferase) DsrC/TusE family protein
MWQPKYPRILSSDEKRKMQKRESMYRKQSRKKTKKYIYMREYSQYFIRKKFVEFNLCPHGGMLLQQTIKDMGLQALESQMEFYNKEESQTRFRRESYRGLADYCETKATKLVLDVSKIVILP